MAGGGRDGLWRKSVARRTSYLAGAAVCLVAITGFALAPRLPAASEALAVLESALTQTYAHVRHLTADDVAVRLVETPDDVLLFDVRELAEFEVSRLPGAIRIDPATATADFLALHGDRVRGKSVIFYCSVGVRSSKLAGRLTDPLAERGARGVYNLSGGIFRWHNDGRPLADAHGATPLVHPYDRTWGRFIQRRSQSSLTPRATP